ncbi:hypothetical protein HDU96_004775 [Phlyctochytrium bullatum]|nr:hypothetical protein HDU96_004775 [Phlyctochytrium bullatum]
MTDSTETTPSATTAGGNGDGIDTASIMLPPTAAAAPPPSSAADRLPMPSQRQPPSSSSTTTTTTTATATRRRPSTTNISSGTGWASPSTRPHGITDNSPRGLKPLPDAAMPFPSSSNASQQPIARAMLMVPQRFAVLNPAGTDNPVWLLQPPPQSPSANVAPSPEPSPKLPPTPSQQPTVFSFRRYESPQLMPVQYPSRLGSVKGSNALPSPKRISSYAIGTPPSNPSSPLSSFYPPLNLGFSHLDLMADAQPLPGPNAAYSGASQVPLTPGQAIRSDNGPSSTASTPVTTPISRPTTPAAVAAAIAAGYSPAAAVLANRQTAFPPFALLPPSAGSSPQTSPNPGGASYPSSPGTPRHGPSRGYSTISTRSIRSAKAPSLAASSRPPASRRSTVSDAATATPPGTPGTDSDTGDNHLDTVYVLGPEETAPPPSEDANNFDLGHSDVESGGEGEGDESEAEDSASEAGDERRKSLADIAVTVQPIDEPSKATVVPHDVAPVAPAAEASAPAPATPVPVVMVSEFQPEPQPAKLPVVAAAADPARPSTATTETAASSTKHRETWFSRMTAKLFRKKNAPRQDDDAVVRVVQEQERAFREEMELDEKVEAGEGATASNAVAPAEGAAAAATGSRRLSVASIPSLGRRRRRGGRRRDAVAELDRFKRSQYKFIKVLGAGAQGTVSLHLHLPTDSIVALKSIPTIVSPTVVTGFRREVEILQKVAVHPSVIRMLDYWEGRRHVYQVFHVCTGGDLGTALPGPVPEEEAVRLLAPLVDAVRFIHELDVLHRDVRPANVFLRRPLTGRESLWELMTIPVLADFGIASYTKFSGRLDSGLPPDFFPHIAPEVVVHKQRFTKAADCFGLATLAIQILLGRGITPTDRADLPASALSADPKTHPLSPLPWRHLSPTCREFVCGLLESDPRVRMTAEQAVHHPWLGMWGVEVKGPVAVKEEEVERCLKEAAAGIGSVEEEVGLEETAAGASVAEIVREGERRREAEEEGIGKGGEEVALSA